MLIINPGTEKQMGATEANAIKVAEQINKDLELPDQRWRRAPERDDERGWFGFIFAGAGGECEVDIPGIDAETVIKGVPFESPRLYVEGSSWLYGYALGFIHDKIVKEVI